MLSVARDPARHGPLGLAGRKIALLAATAVVSINIWTGGPLFALWVGSQVQGDSGLSMGTVFVVVVVLAVVVFLLALALAWLNTRYDELLDRPPPPRHQYPWQRGIRAERERDVRRERGVTGFERAMIVSVVAAFLIFEAWFFLYAHYSFPG